MKKTSRKLRKKTGIFFEFHRDVFIKRARRLPFVRSFPKGGRRVSSNSFFGGGGEKEKRLLF